MRLLFLFLALMVSYCSTSVLGQHPEKTFDEHRILVVGVTDFPPMIIIDSKNGGISGSDYSMFEGIASDQSWREGIDYEYRVISSFSEMIEQVTNGVVDVAIAGVSITELRLRKMTFSQPYKASGQRILIPPSRAKIDILAYLSQFLRTEIAVGVFALLCNFGFFGIVLWLVEKNKESGNIKTPMEGAQAAVDIGTTIGFGRHWPQTNLGNVLLLVCFFSTSLLSAAIFATLTTNKMVYTRAASINGPRDLKDKTIAVVGGTTSIKAAKRYNPTKIVSTKNFYQAVVEMRLGNVEAVVADDPVVLNYVKEHGDHAAVAGLIFHPENYGIAITSNRSELVKLFSISIAKLQESGKLAAIEKLWYGE